MNMTHYMELLAVNQPWNLLIYMAVPVVLAETVAITELYLLYTRNYDGAVRNLNRAASVLVGIYFTGVFLYLMTNAVMPITVAGQWRGPADIIAVASYLAGIVPLAGMALIDLGVIGRNRDEHARMGMHAAMVGVFLVVAHIAMIFGMLDPTVLGGAMGGHSGH
jgi:hypothetical protein